MDIYNLIKRVKGRSKTLFKKLGEVEIATEWEGLTMLIDRKTGSFIYGGSDFLADRLENEQALLPNFKATIKTLGSRMNMEEIMSISNLKKTKIVKPSPSKGHGSMSFLPGQGNSTISNVEGGQVENSIVAGDDEGDLRTDMGTTSFGRQKAGVRKSIFVGGKPPMSRRGRGKNEPEGVRGGGVKKRGGGAKIRGGGAKIRGGGAKVRGGGAKVRGGGAMS